MSEYKYKIVNGELVELTPEEIAELEERDKHPPPELPTPLDANARIDMAMQMLQAALPTPPDEATVRRMDEQQLADYVAGLSAAIRGMLAGFKGRQPRG